MQILGSSKFDLINEKFSHKITLETWFVFACTFGYILAFLNYFEIALLSKTINVVIRLLTFIFSLIVIFKNFQKIIRSKLVWILAVFFSLYFIKTVYTLFFNPEYENFPAEIRNVLFYYSLLVVPLPTVALLHFDYSKVNFRKLYLMIFYFLLVIAILHIFWLTYAIITNNPHSIFRSYYINTGHYGSSLLILCAFDYAFMKRLKPHLLTSGIISSAYLILASGARSPVLALFVAAFVMLIVYRSRKWWFYFFFFGVSFVFVVYTMHYLGHQLPFFERVFSAIFEGNASGRSFFLQKGIDEFLKYPIIGGIVIFQDGSYPHNYFVDILMSTGIVGLILLLFYGKFAIVGIVKILRNLHDYQEAAVFVFFLLQYFVLSQTSGSALTSFEMWHFSALVIGLSLYKKYEKIKSNDGGGNPPRNH